jgi:hypothetical protein
MAATMTALEACPFCGESHDLHIQYGWPIVCKRCGAKGGHSWNWMTWTQELAVKAWNVRALSAREEQVRRGALVEGARWALKEARPFGGTGIDDIDPAALEREKGKP